MRTLQCTESQIFYLFCLWKYKKLPSKVVKKSARSPLTLPKWPKTANPFYEFGSRCISVSFISVDTDRTSTPCVCLYWNSVSLTLPPSCTVSRNLWILEFHAFMKFLDFLASKSQTSYDLSDLKNVLFQNGLKSKQSS